MKVYDDMDFHGSSQQVIDFQNKKLRVDDTISQDCLKEYDKKMTEIMFVRQEAGVLHNSFEWAYQVYALMPAYSWWNVQIIKKR